MISSLLPPVGEQTHPSGIPLTAETSGRSTLPFPTQRACQRPDAHVTKLLTMAATIVCQPLFLIQIAWAIYAYSGTTTDPTSAAAWKWLVENGVAQPTDPSRAIAKNSKGTIGILYIVYNGLDKKTGFPTYTANLAISDNHGLTFTTQKLEKFLSPAKDAGDQRQRVLGDYEQLKAVGTTLYGVFPGNGVPFGRPFANIDPLFFKTTA
jgi:hypothetical protein